jgi:hypothetical protein
MAAVTARMHVPCGDVQKGEDRAILELVFVMQFREALAMPVRHFTPS